MLNNIFKFYITVFVLLFTIALYAGTENLVILHTNDLHAHLMKEPREAGFAAIAAYIKKMKQENKHIIVLDAGDQITGTPVSSIFRGEPIYHITSLMGYDASTLGNHEFDFGWKQTKKFIDIATYPVICANVLDPGGKLIADRAWKIFNANGIKVGVFGLLTPKTPEMVTKSGIKGVKFLPEIETAKKMVAELKGKCDIIIAVTHDGVKEDKKLAAAVNGIDIIVGGHSHTTIRKLLKVNNTYIVQTGCYGHYVGIEKAEIDMKNRKLIHLTSDLVPPYKLPPPDPQVQKVVELWESKVRQKVDQTIGTSGHSFTKAELRKLFEKVIKDKTNSDFGYYNSGGIRDSLLKGKITIRTIWNIEPFGNSIIICTIKGRNIGGVLLRELRKAKYPINSEKDYTIATNNFVAGHPGRFIGKPDKTVNTDINVRQAVIDYITQKCSENKTL